MKLEIISMHLVNFKGVRDLELTFNGENVVIAGDNGTGKTTLFDAFTWLLFGKDSRDQDQTKFDIKPIDPATGEPIHRCDYFVEAVLSVDGSRQTLRRVWRETWKRGAGKTEPVLSGHETAFFVNGVNVGTKKAFDEIVRGWITEGVFRMITNPLYFIDNRFTEWTKRRETLLSLAGEVDKTEINAQFADLIAAMNGEPLAMFKKRIAAEKRENKVELAKCEPAIAAYKRAMPDDVNVDLLNEQRDQLTREYNNTIAGIRAKIDAIDAEIAAMLAGDKAVDAEIAANRDRIDEYREQISQIKKDREHLISTATESARRANNARQNAVFAASDELIRLNRELDGLKHTRNEKVELIDVYTRRIEEAESELSEIKTKYVSTKNAAFTYTPATHCPYCKQSLPAEQIESVSTAARDAWVEEQKRKLRALIDSANAKKSEIESFRTKIDAADLVITECDKKTAETTEIRDNEMRRHAEAVALPVQDLDAVTAAVQMSEEYGRLNVAESELNAKIAEIENHISSLRTADTTDASRRINELERAVADERVKYNASLKPIEQQMSTIAERDRVQKLIDEEIAREQKLADRIAELERLEFDAMEYSKADIAAVEDNINRRFNIARWRMFETTLDGDDKECCEVMDVNGVPYKSMNDAKRILIGLDVIRAFCEFYNVSAPVFIDNGESITARDFDIKSQVIRLNVNENYSKLTIL